LHARWQLFFIAHECCSKRRFRLGGRPDFPGRPIRREGAGANPLGHGIGSPDKKPSPNKVELE
jgi:hypothetical protein